VDTEPDEVIVTRIRDHVGVVQTWHTGDGITLSLDMWPAGDEDERDREADEETGIPPER
jgi:hypothetical protein